MKKILTILDKGFEGLYDLVVNNINKVLFMDTHGWAEKELLLCLELIALMPLQPLYFSLYFTKKFKDYISEKRKKEKEEIIEISNEDNVTEEVKEIKENEISESTSEKKYSYKFNHDIQDNYIDYEQLKQSYDENNKKKIKRR